jgi:two-component system, chemotaxis family, chemotaxis protein CheY
MDFTPYSVLVADEATPSKQICELLHSFGFRSFFRADTPDAALGLLKSQFLNLALISLQLEPDGADLIQAIRRTLPDPKRRMPILAVSSASDTASVLRARKAGANHFLVRPYTIGNLLKSIEGVLHDSREFIVAQGYVGPDRRVHFDPAFLGTGRRASDRSAQAAM